MTEVSDEDEDEDTTSIGSDSPLFVASGRRLKQIDHVGVVRKDPESGYLGQMPVDMSEATLSSKWGGGLYRLEAKNSLNQVLAVRSVKLAGDPVFSSEIEERRWRKQNGLNDRGGGEPGGLSVKDLLLVIEQKDEKRRAEMLDREDRLRQEQEEREEREQKARDERAATAQREADDRKAREQKETEEREDRRRREAREDDERRARIHREDMERLSNQNAQQLAQSQQFFTQLATTLKSESAAAAKGPASTGGEMVKALLTGLQIAREMKGDGGGGGPAEPQDLLTSLVSRLPETLAEIRQTAAGVYGELKSKGAAAPPAAPGRPAGDRLTITGPTAAKAKRVLLALKAAGKDPEAELDRLLSFAASAVGVDEPIQQAHAEEAAESAPAPVDRTKQRRARAGVRTKQAPRARPPAAPAAARRPRSIRKARA